MGRDAKFKLEELYGCPVVLRIHTWFAHPLQHAHAAENALLTMICCMILADVGKTSVQPFHVQASIILNMRMSVPPLSWPVQARGHASMTNT